MLAGDLGLVALLGVVLEGLVVVPVAVVVDQLPTPLLHLSLRGGRRAGQTTA